MYDSSWLKYQSSLALTCLWPDHIPASASSRISKLTHVNDPTLNASSRAAQNLSSAHHEHAPMTSTTTNNFYLQPSQNGGVRAESPLSKPAYGHTEESESDASSDVNEFVAAGRRDPDVYEKTLESWRAFIRRPIVRMVEKESHIIAAMQVLRSAVQ